MELEVVQIHWNDVYRDIARIPEAHRRDVHGQPIPEGRICRISIGEKHTLLSIRGQTEHKNPAIHIDDKTRGVLSVSINDKVDVQLCRVWWIGQFLWVWRASDPAYRIASRVAVVSIILSAIGLFVSVISLFWR